MPKYFFDKRDNGVLEPDEEAPGIGTARAPLRGVPSARLRATVRIGDGGDLNGLVAQLGSVRLPMRPVVDGWSAAEDGELTVAGDVPAELLAPEGPDALTPFVLRMPGASQAQVLESYLEVPGPSPVKLPCAVSAGIWALRCGSSIRKAVARAWRVILR